MSAEQEGHVPAIFVPVTTKGNHPDGAPANALEVKYKGDQLTEWFDDSISKGNFGSMYKAYLYCILAFIAFLYFYSINIYVTAVFAYLTGYFWSKVLIMYAWGIEWFKGKALIKTK